MDENINPQAAVENGRGVETQTPLSVLIISVLLLLYGTLSTLLTLVMIGFIMIYASALGNALGGASHNIPENNSLTVTLVIIVTILPFILSIVASAGLWYLKKWSIWLLNINSIAYIMFLALFTADRDGAFFGVLCPGLLLTLIALYVAYKHRKLFT